MLILFGSIFRVELGCGNLAQEQTGAHRTKFGNNSYWPLAKSNSDMGLRTLNIFPLTLFAKLDRYIYIVYIVLVPPPEPRKENCFLAFRRHIKNCDNKLVRLGSEIERKCYLFTYCKHWVYFSFLLASKLKPHWK